MRPDRLLKLLRRLEDAVLVALFAGMLVLAATQILLRNLFDLGLGWADPLLRAMVLWVALAGAMAAARGDRHLTVDVLTRHLGPRALAGVRLLTDGLAAAVCSVLAWHGARFTAMEREAGASAFSGVPAWMVEAVIPVAFGVMAVRYVALAWGRLSALRPPGRQVP